MSGVARKTCMQDTDIKTINWEKNKTNIIKRIFERGKQQELEEIIRFYGKEEIEKVLLQFKGRSTSIDEKINLILRELYV